MAIIEQGRKATHRITILDIETNKSKTLSLEEKKLTVEEIHQILYDNLENLLKKT